MRCGPIFFYLPPFVTNFLQLPFVNRDVVYHYHDSVPNVTQTSLILASSPSALCGYIGLYFGFKRFYQGFEMYPMHLEENIIVTNTSHCIFQFNYSSQVKYYCSELLSINIIFRLFDTFNLRNSLGLQYTLPQVDLAVIQFHVF